MAVKEQYKNTWTYHGIIRLPIFNGFIFNHGTASRRNTRTSVHIKNCIDQTLTYEVLEEKQDRLFGTEVISPSYDKEFIDRVVAELNNKVLKKSSTKALTLKAWINSLSVLGSIKQGYYEAVRSSNLSETECCFIPACVSNAELITVIKAVEDSWYYKNATLRISAKPYSTKTRAEKEKSAKPLPIKYCSYMIQQLRQGKTYAECLSYKRAVVQSLLYAYTLSTQKDFKNLTDIKVIITGDDKEKHMDIYNYLKTDPTFQLIECESDSEVIEEYKNIPIDTDIVLMNPPYKGNLHLKIMADVLNSVKPSCIVINISPIRWLQDPQAAQKSTSDYNVFKAAVYDRINSVEQIPAREGQEAFGIVLAADLGIYTFNNAAVGNFTGLISSIIYKVINKMTAKPNIEKDKQDGWRVRIPLILSGGRSGGRGGKKWYGLGFLGPFYDGMKDGKPWYEFYTKNQYTKTTATISNSIKFDTEIEADNFCNSLKTTFGLYITYNLIPDNHVTINTIMWLDDYTKTWTNEELCRYFDISGFISDTEAVIGSEWEEILNFTKAEGIC